MNEWRKCFLEGCMNIEDDRWIAHLNKCREKVMLGMFFDYEGDIQGSKLSIKNFALLRLARNFLTVRSRCDGALSCKRNKSFVAHFSDHFCVIAFRSRCSRCLRNAVKRKCSEKMSSKGLVSFTRQCSIMS